MYKNMHIQNLLCFAVFFFKAETESYHVCISLKFAFVIYWGNKDIMYLNTYFFI